MRYPPPVLDGNGITHWCRLVLWLSEEAFRDNINDPSSIWDLGTIYSKPLIDDGNGLLDRIEAHIDRALDAGYVHADRARNIKDAIGDFRDGDDANKTRNLNELLSNGTRRLAGKADTHVAGMLKRLADDGLYMPNNHTLAGSHASIDDKLPELWDTVGHIGKKERTFGSLTMRELYSTPLKSFSYSLRTAIRTAKQLAILWVHPSERDLPDPTSDPNTPGALLYDSERNSKCCAGPMGCIDTDDEESYCGLTETGECNALSDPCPN